VNALVKFVESYWWLALIFGGGVGASVRQAVHQHHSRRLEILEAKSRMRAEAAAGPPEPQPVCGCTHHLSFHNPRTATCAVDGCRCQQYVGPEPLGHVVPLPLVDPAMIDAEADPQD
jgi:hypothetical protein